MSIQTKADLHPVIAKAMNGAADFFAGDKAQEWLAERIQKAEAEGQPFGMDYTLRVYVKGGVPQVRLIASPGMQLQLMSWHGDTP